MDLSRYHFVVLVLVIVGFIRDGNPKDFDKKNITKDHTNCPYSKIIEDVFKIHNKTAQTGIHVEDQERANQFLKHFVKNITTKSDDDGQNKSLHDDQVNDIIASINRIKNNITSENSRINVEDHLNEAIVLNYPLKPDGTNAKNSENLQETKKIVPVHKTDFETFTDVPNNTKTEDKEKPTYVEIMTIEPNNANKPNSSSHNIIEILKHLMPMFNSTLTKESHNITIIERDHMKNHSFSEVKNMSTIVVTYCDNENYTKLNVSFDSNADTVIKVSMNNATERNGFLQEDDDDDDSIPEANLTVGEKKDLIEAAEYGMKKMHELYSLVEPKLYSMGLWLDDTNPARYVAAFNAPADDVARYSRYGYASLQAATRLRQLTGGGSYGGLEGRTEEALFPSAGAMRQSPLMEHCPIRGTPKCPPASKRYRTHDGTCNNLHRPRWGSTMTPVQRFLTPAYSDGLSAPRRSVTGSKLPSAREISSSVHESQNVETPGITHLLMQWGQFLDHDVTSSSQSRGFNGSVPRCCKDGGKDFVPREFMHPECLPISVPASDPFYGPRGVRCLDFVRSSPASRDDCALGWREQLNQVSGYIDASPLYGSSARKSDKLRLFRNGMLQYGRVQSRRPILPPERRDELCRGGAVSTDCFKSGDARVNEHPGLVAAHIVWLRQHNRMAQEIAHLNPHWSDEKIYQETRKIVGAMVQQITYKEFLPIVLGTEVMRLFDLNPLKKGFYKNYNTKINPSPASAFGSAAFRFGHSLVQPSMVRFDRFHRPMSNNVSLHNEMTNPSNIWSMGAVDRLLLGMVNQPIQKRDEFITAELTNHLFQTPQFDFGMDLAAINIQRGRDHGVPAYTSWREPCGLSQITEFEDLFRVMPVRAVRKLQALYKDVEDIDLFTGGMAERPVIGGLVGPTFACIIAQQFSNLRKGDRFWYENGGFDNSFTPAQLQQIRRVSFAQVLCRTLDTIDNIQPFVFLSSNSPDNQRIPCANGALNNFDLSPWVEIDSDTNELGKSENSDDLTVQPLIKTTSTKPTTTVKVKPPKLATSNTIPQTKPLPLSVLANMTKAHSLTKHRPNTRRNVTDTVDKRNHSDTMTKLKGTVQKLDDKLDFKNKSKRFENTDNDKLDERRRPAYNQYTDYDEDNDEDTQSVQSVVINNLQHKRPSSYNKRPIISVTENIDKYTYLINYVPRPTQSWRQTTKRPYKDRDVVKVTYQNYDDTYRRHNKPYYNNRQDDRPLTDYDYKRKRPDRYTTRQDYYHSSARSNDETPATVEKIDKGLNTATTDNLHKLVTFGYVGTYKGDLTKSDDKRATKIDLTKQNQDEIISKDFSTYDNNKHDSPSDVNSMKLSTFYHFETVTKPYNTLQRSTRKDDETKPNYDSTNSKYFYVKNVLHKYPDMNSTLTDKTFKSDDPEDIIIENYNNPGIPAYMDVEERSSADKLALLKELEETAKSADSRPKRPKPKDNPAKTPSVAFQVMPSENSPSQWAVYDENIDLPDGLPHRMPAIQIDPYALKEIPRPINLSRKKRRPGRS